MQILDTICAQVQAMRMPLYAVTAAAAARAGTPVLLILHWHGFRRRTPLTLPGQTIAPRAVAGSAMQLSQRWASFDELEGALVDAAWQLGAWDVERLVQRPWRRLGAPASEALACHRAFGAYPDAPDEEGVVMDAPDRDDLLELAARRGYVRWLFRPRKAGLWQSLDDEDATLGPGGGRALPCPVPRRAFDGRMPSRVVYRLGHGARLILRDT